MTTLASILQLEECESRFQFLVEELHYPPYESPGNCVIFTIIGHDSSHCAKIYSYLCDQIISYSLTHNKKWQLIHNVSCYTIIFGDLFRKGLDGSLIRCLEKYESKCALAEVHDVICGSHSNGLGLAQKLLRSGYYWPTMQTNVVCYAKSCKKF